MKQIIPDNKNLGFINAGKLIMNPTPIITIPNNSSPFAA